MPNKLKATILIVDDEEINLEILNEALSTEYRVLRCCSAPEVMLIAEREQPDLILLDIGMPEMDGYEVCKALKKGDTTRHIPIIFSTAFDSPEHEIKGFECGASDYITKPFNIRLIKHRVSNLVALKLKTDLLEELANLDGLTQIPNRRHFNAEFDAEWRRAVRQRSVISVCMLDIDFFKQFNDHYGHAAGDSCLIDIANQLYVHSKRSGDIVARYGGEEFVMILPENSSANATLFAEHLRHKIVSLAIKHARSSCADVVTISIGVASVKAGKSIKKEVLLQQADEQLYLAKKKGKNQVVAIDL